MNIIRHIFDKESANAYIVEQRVNTITSHMEILKMNAAELCEKIESIMTREDYRSQLTQDQQIALGNLHIKTLHYMNLLTEENKNL